MCRITVILLIVPLFPVLVTAQDMKPMQDLFTEAEYYLVNEEFADALPVYLQLYEKLPGHANLAYRIGVCYLNINGKKNLATSYLETATENMSAKNREGTISHIAAPYNALYDLALAYMINFQFDKAKAAFEKYAGTLLPDDDENQNFIQQHIKSCNTAKELIAKPVSFTSENMGTIFNDDKANFNPVISADCNTFAFMVSLKFYDAIMVSRKVKGKWSIPVNIIPELQSDGDMYISCLTTDGNTLFLSKDDNFNSDLYYSTYDGSRWSKTIKLNKNINTRYWESHAFISEDGNQLIFASDRPGGFGGLDLYISKKIKEEWGPAVNLGPEINTPFNEDRPFLVNKGKSLFFSSQGHTNIGGYDIFRSELQPNDLWTKPVNIGYPINTPDNNFFFMPVGAGKTGYYTIYKDAGGEGDEDIYKITFK